MTGTNVIDAAKWAYNYKKLFNTKYTFDPFEGFKDADRTELDMYKACCTYLDSIESAYTTFMENDNIRKEQI